MSRVNPRLSWPRRQGTSVAAEHKQDSSACFYVQLGSYHNCQGSPAKIAPRTAARVHECQVRVHRSKMNNRYGTNYVLLNKSPAPLQWKIEGGAGEGKKRGAEDR